MIADILDACSSFSILVLRIRKRKALDEEEMPTGREFEKLTAKKERKAAREEAKECRTILQLRDCRYTSKRPQQNRRKEEAVQMELI